MSNTDSTAQIIPYYSHPHVYTVINDNTYYDETVNTDVASDTSLPYSTMVVTGADKGIDNTFIRLQNLSTKQALFGVGNFAKYGQSSIQADVLFNGYTNVWFCRVLPDNATYANLVVVAYYRKGKILDELGQETGKSRLEIKFGTVSAGKPTLEEGSKSDDDIDAFARSLVTTTADPQTGYMCVPLFYIRAIGRGKYGNNLSMRFGRDTDAEKEYNGKMYDFYLINNESATVVSNVFAGSLYQTTKYDTSTLIDDVVSQYATGSSPIAAKTYDEYLEKIFEYYHEIAVENYNYIQQSGAAEADVEEVTAALAITDEQFDILFGKVLNTRTSEEIPYYRNYTQDPDNVWVDPDLEIPATESASKPLNISDWTTAFVGARVLVASDSLNDGKRMIYKIISIDSETGNILYDEGTETAIDANQYDGIDLTQSVGWALTNGSDGDFESITVNGETREPSSAEMKLLLSREYVKAIRGEKDRRILSPARIDLDFIFDANYNMTSTDSVALDTTTIPLYDNSTVLTNQDAQQLAILGTTSDSTLSFSDLNVKQALYDLNEFRCINGMTVAKPNVGSAGCSLYLDCGLVGSKTLEVNSELNAIIDMFADYTGRQTSIDLGYYQMFDPLTKKKINVTVDYLIAQGLIPHIIKYGLNKPFVYNYAQVTSVQKDTSTTSSGAMIRDSFVPDIDLIDWDVKEKLYTSRINYWLSKDEGRTVQRAVQNTRQTEASALLEENNVRVLNTLKKEMEEACRGYLYSWNEQEVRKGFTDAQMKKFSPWIGTMVQDIDISFEANEWEQERMIMHCYVSVKFRDIVKRIILEININRPDYSSSSDGGES